MIHEYSRVRVRGTDVIGTVIDFDAGSDHCIIDPDYFMHDSFQSDPVEHALSDVDELVEVDEHSRKDLCQSFDLFVFTNGVESWIDSGNQLVIKKTDQGYRVFMAKPQDSSLPLDLEGGQAKELLAGVGKLKAYRWAEHLLPKGYMVLDGYSWSMEFYQGNRFFSCSGSNVTPKELREFVEYTASLGLPRIDCLDN